MNGLLTGFPLQKKTVFFRQMATMITSALPIDRAITTSGSGGILPQASTIAQQVLGGKSFSQALATYPLLFSQYEIALINTGEITGTLDVQLNVLAKELEQNQQLTQALYAKMLYPIFVAHFAVFVPSLVVLVQDGFAPYLRLTLGTLLPIYAILGLLWTCYRLGSSSNYFRYMIDTGLNLVPIIGKALRLSALTRFTRSLSHLIEAGTLPYHSFQTASAACGNTWVSSQLQASYRKTGSDGKVSQMMKQSHLFPITVLSLVESGEETGQPGPLLAKAAELLEMEYHNRVHMVMTILPVLVLLGVGVLVGLRVYSLLKATYAPIFQM